MDLTILVLAAALVAMIVTFQVTRRRWQVVVRADYIRTYVLPSGLFEKLRAKHPDLALKDCQLVAAALRHFFLAHLKSGRQFVSMPSQVVDDLWHEFILYTKDYARFCDGAFGQFMHHTPAVVLTTDKQSNTGLRRCWWYTCKEENLDPRKATRLPLLFAIDAKLKIKNGFHYALDCSGLKGAAQNNQGSGTPYCGGDVSNTSFDGSTDGFGDASGGADGGGDGGGGGGCGGGGD